MSLSSATWLMKSTERPSSPVATSAPFESESEQTTPPSSMTLRAANWATLPAPRDDDALALEVLAAREADHLLGVVDAAVASRLGADLGPAKVVALAREDADPLVANLLVRAEEEADLAATDTDVAGGNVRVLAGCAGREGSEFAKVSDAASRQGEIQAYRGPTHPMWRESSRMKD